MNHIYQVGVGGSNLLAPIANLNIISNLVVLKLPANLVRI